MKLKNIAKLFIYVWLRRKFNNKIALKALPIVLDQLESKYPYAIVNIEGLEVNARPSTLKGSKYGVRIWING